MRNPMLAAAAAFATLLSTAAAVPLAPPTTAMVEGQATISHDAGNNQFCAGDPKAALCP